MVELVLTVILTLFPFFHVPFGKGWIFNRLKFQGDIPTIHLSLYIGSNEPYLDCRAIYFTRPFGWFLFYSSVHVAAHRVHLQLVTLENGFEARTPRSNIRPLLANANNVASV